MRGARRGNVLSAVIAELGQIDIGEKVLPGAEQDRGNGEVHFVDQPRAEILPDGCGSPPSRMSLPLAASVARCSATSMPSVTKWKVVPPLMVIGARGDW